MGFQLLQFFNGQHTTIDITLDSSSDNYYQVYLREQSARCHITSVDLATQPFSFSIKRFFYFQSFHRYLVMVPEPL